MDNRRIRNVAAAVTMALATATACGVASASDLVNFTTIFNTDWTSAGVGQVRNGNGTASIALSGVSGTVTKAYLYWHGPTNVTADPSTANSNITFAGNSIVGSFLGASSDNCWGFQNSVAYRADVTSLVTGNGNYSLANFIKPNVQINGFSLVAFFDDGNATNNRDVVIFDGNDSNIINSFDAPGWNITLAGINYSSGNANIQFHVSDGQTFPDAAVIENGVNTIFPAGSVFDGNTVPGAGSGFPGNGFLWDIKNADVTSLLSPGLNTMNITTGVNSDCLSCVAILIDLPAGAAPPAIPEPGTLLSLIAGLAALGAARRRRTA